MQAKRTATRVAGVLIALAVWQVAGMRAGDAMLATPVAAIAARWDQLGDAELWAALGGLLGQMLLGYALALVIGIPLGIGMGRSRVIEAVAKPWASMFVVMSAAALVPLFIILMGRGTLFRTTIVFMVTVWYVVLTVYQAARGVSPRLLNVAVSFGSNPWQRFRFVVLPALFPFLLVAARVGLTHALRAAVTAEMFIGAGLGRAHQQCRASISPPPGCSA